MINNYLENVFPVSGLEKNKTDVIKEILALFLVLVHARANTVLSEIILINYILMVSGYLICSYFFFISGYGMMVSFNKNPNYVKNIIKRNILPLYIQYMLILIITVIYRSLMLKENIEWLFIIRSLTFSGTYVIYGWYIQVAIIVYLLYFVVFSLKISKKAKKALFAGCILLYILVCIIINCKSMWYDSVICVVMGIYIADLPRSNNNTKYSVLMRIVCLLGATIFIVLGNSTIITKIGLPE